MGIDKESYEAAKIDGANRFQCIWNISMPALKPTIITLAVRSFAHNLKVNCDKFDRLMGKDIILMKKTDNIDTVVFRRLTQNTEYGVSSAAGFYQSVVYLIFIYSVKGVVKKVSPENALFQ